MNDEVRRRRDEFEGGSARQHQVMCECTRPTCAEMFVVPVDRLDSTRADDALYLVVPAHAEASSVVELGDSHVVVRFEGT